MLKFNSKSLIINELDPSLKEHLEKIAEKEQQTVKQKLQRQQQKQARVEAVQRQFLDWAERKEGMIKEKLEKCSKNKEDHLSKIVKKCKEHEKFIGERLKNYQSKKKASLREAWKKAEKYKNEVEDRSSKNVSRERSMPKVRDQNLAESHMLTHLEVPQNDHREYLSTHNNNMSKIYGNASKDYWAELNQSVKQLKVSEHIQFLDELEQKMQEKGKMGDKLKETLARFKQNTFDTQQTRIQQLGQRLEKIERSRLRKFQLVKKKKQKHQTVNDDDISHDDHNPKKKVDRSQRIHSETMMREKRVRDWSQMNKNKRMQVFQANLQNGTDYLESQKIKYLKASLAKKITLSAIEKKLYFERLNH